MSGLKTNFDWNQLRAFIATVEAGSITAAAASLGTTQPTISRQITSLEERLGLTLLERGPRGMTLTAPGEALLRDAKQMYEAANRISTAAADHANTTEGVVTISASDAICVYRLPRIIAELRQIAPGIELRVMSENQTANLIQREADIAVRHYRPQQPDLIAKVILDSHAYLYASHAYLEARGRPETIADLVGKDFIGFGDPVHLQEVFQKLGVSLSEANFRLIANSWSGAWELAKADLGLAFMMKEIGERTDGMERLLVDETKQSMTYWLVAHRELRNNPRLRVVFDHLALRLSEM